MQKSSETLSNNLPLIKLRKQKNTFKSLLDIGNSVEDLINKDPEIQSIKKKFTSIEKLLNVIKELTTTNKSQQQHIERLESEKHTLREKIKRLKVINANVIGLLKQSENEKIKKVAPLFINCNTGEAHNYLNISNMQQEIEKLTKENFDLTTQLKQLSTFKKEAQTENKLVHKLLKNYRLKSEVGRIPKQFLETKDDTSSSMNSIRHLKSDNQKQVYVRTKSKVHNDMNKWIKVYKAMERISSFTTYKEVLIYITK